MDFNKLVENLTSHTAFLIYFAVIIVLLCVLVYNLVYKHEGLLGSGVVDQVFTSGATMRRLAQEPTSTNQGEYTIVHNAEIKELIPGVIPKNKGERLVSERGEPDFWEISAELDAYRSAQTAGLMQDTTAYGGGSEAGMAPPAAAAPAVAEYLARHSAAGQAEQQLLTQMLYH